MNSLINFKGKVKSFNINEQYVNIENNENKKIKVNLNFKLLKKISINKECTFLNFFKMKDGQFYFSNLSDIKVKEETFLEFHFLDFDEIKEKKLIE